MDDNGHKPDLEPAKLVSGRLCYSTAQAVELLKQGKPGDSINRHTMAAKIGRSCDVQTLGYGNVCSAIRHVESQFGIVWRWNKASKSWVRLNDIQCVGETRALIHSARRRARRSMHVAKSVDQANLDPDARRDHGLNVVVTGMMLTSSSTGFRNKLAEMPTLAQPETSKVLALFREKSE